jgi:tRNA modification GTPase
MRVIRAAQLNSAQFPHRHLSTLKSITTKSFHTPQVNVVPLLPTSIRHVPNGSAPKGATRARFSSSLSYFDGALPLSPAQKETIYALSTPPGRAGIAVIRISGPAVLDVYRNLVKKKTQRDVSQFTGDLHVEPWKMQRCSIVDPTTKQVLDEGLAVYFAGIYLLYWHE